MSARKQHARWRFANAELDPYLRELLIDGKPAAIEPKSFDVLTQLLDHAGELLTFEELLESVWTGRIVSEATVTNTIFKIRKVLGDDNQAIIKTIPRAGYRLVAPVERVVDEQSAASTRTDLQAGSEVPGRDCWRLAENLGSGGYGEAWLARHDTTGERRVFKFCHDDDRLPAFKREVTLYRLLRQAQEDRDDIARLLEWNFDQPPYFIESEYAGENLLRWSQARGGLASMPLEQRLQLMVRIATAVAAAHSVGVLHKDLKPENILVQEQDGALKVRLCDFGVGRLLDQDRLGQLGITRLGFTQTVATDASITGTWLYLAPELVSSGTPSVQSDVYALGVLLFQLAVGNLSEPMPHGWEIAIEDELLRQDIADATCGDRGKRIASAQTLADRLADLPERRAEQARRRSEEQRAEKSRKALDRARVRRPWLIAAGLILMAGLLSSLYMARQAHEQARLAQAFSSFLADDILNGADRYTAKGPEPSMKRAIVNALPTVSKRFGNEPGVEAPLDTTLAQALKLMYDPADALPLDQRALDLYQRQFGDQDLRTLQAKIEVAVDLRRMGKPADARKLFEAAWPSIKPRLAATDPELFYVRRLQAELACTHPGCDEAIPLFRQLIADIEATKANDPLLRTVEMDYAAFLDNSNHMDEAEQRLQQWLPEVVQRYGDKSIQVMQMQNQFGYAFLQQHRYGEAEPHFRAALTAMDAAMGSDNPWRVAYVRPLADTYMGEERFADALAMRKQAYEEVSRSAGEHVADRDAAADVADSLDSLGRFDEALTWAQKAADAAHQDAASYKERYLFSSFVRASVLVHLHRAQEAQALLGEVMPMIQERFGNNVDIQTQLLHLQAELSVAQHKFPTARDFAQREIDLDEKNWGRDDPASRKARALLQSIPVA